MFHKSTIFKLAFSMIFNLADFSLCIGLIWFVVLKIKLKMKSCSRTYNNTYSISIYIPRTLCTEDRWWYIIYLFFCFYSLYEFFKRLSKFRLDKWRSDQKSCKGKCCYLNIYVTLIRYGFGYIMVGKTPHRKRLYIYYIHIFFLSFLFWIHCCPSICSKLYEYQ